MKKNKMMRIASVLLVAVLLSTCAISGTFAKYITTSTGTDTARVAYWGFGATNVEFDLFRHNDSAVSGPKDDKDLLAPGTSNEASVSLAFTPNGNIDAPEVAYTYSVTVSVSGDTSAFDDNPNFVWTFNRGEYSSFAALKQAVDKQETLAAGQRPSVETYTIGWNWKFNNDENNEKDNAMGNATNLANMTVTLRIEAAQLDTYSAPAQNNEPAGGDAQS